MTNIEAVYETKEVKVYHGDCLEIMPSWDAGSFDVVLTDPPFGVRDESWDDMDERELARFCMAWLSQVRRMAPELVVFCNQDHILNDLCSMLYRRVRRLIWNKPPGSQYAGGRECGVWYAYETILHCHDRATWSVVEPKDAEVGRLIRAAREAAGLSKGAVDIAIRGKRTGLCYRWEEGACLPTSEQVAILAPLLDLNGEFHDALNRASQVKTQVVSAARRQASIHAARAIDVLTYRTVTNGDHPCEKPVGLIQEILTSLGSSWQTVLDPFAGSGSTGKACILAGKTAVLIEREDEYIPVIRRGLSERETPLFTVNRLDRPMLAGF